MIKAVFTLQNISGSSDILFYLVESIITSGKDILEHVLNIINEFRHSDSFLDVFLS